MNPKSIIILDRDGVINFDSPDYIKSPEEWQPIPNSLEAIADLYHAGYAVYVATNQSGIARGLYSVTTLEKIHSKMIQMLESHGAHFAGIFYCAHVDKDQCECRKPKPGLVKQILSRHPSLQTPVRMVGDALRDCQAAVAAGVEPILVRTGKGAVTATHLPLSLRQTPIYNDLSEYVKTLLNG